MFAPEATDVFSTSRVAIVVTVIPLTAVAWSPALNVSTVSVFHGTPTLPRMRSTMSDAVIGPLRAALCENAFGAISVPAPARAENLRLERWLISYRSYQQLFSLRTAWKALRVLPSSRIARLPLHPTGQIRIRARKFREIL